MAEKEKLNVTEVSENQNISTNGEMDSSGKVYTL